MIFPVVLSVTFSAAIFAVVKSTEIEFPAEILYADLKGIAKYHEKFGEMPNAYVWWPDSITFFIDTTPEGYLKVHGTFTFDNGTSEGLYYKDRTFFVDDSPTSALKKLPPGTLLRYQNRALELDPPEEEFLSIRYFSFAEVQHEKLRFYLPKKVLSDRNKNPLDSSKNKIRINGYTLKYVVSGNHKLERKHKLQVLIGTKQDDSLIVTASRKAHRLFFYPFAEREFSIPSTQDVWSDPLENVFGFRMARTGFLLKNQPGKTKAICSSPGSSSPNPRQPIGSPEFFEDLLEEVKLKTKRYIISYSVRRLISPKDLPLVVRGQNLVMKQNLKQGRHLVKKCPYTIEFEDGRKFDILKEWVKEICTDLKLLWINSQYGPLRLPLANVEDSFRSI